MSDTLTEIPSNPLAKNFTIKSLLQFAFPTIMMMIFMGFYTIGDTIIISRFVNTDALSALNIVTPVINIIVGLGAMLATGGSAIVAIAGSLFIDNIIWGKTGLSNIPN